MIRCCHDSQDIRYRTPKGALKTNDTVSLCIRAEGAVEGLSCRMHLWQTLTGGRQIPMEKEAMEGGACLFRVSLTLEEADLCGYYFLLEDGENTYYYGNNEEKLGGKGALYTYEPPAFQITVYNEAPVPKWYKDSIVYQIFPDRFARDDAWMEKQQAADELRNFAAGSGDKSLSASPWKGARRVIQQDWDDVPYYTKNEKGEVTRWPFFGGTLQGIREKLFYIKSMGAGAIYLNPIFLASSNHKYDTADYMMIDPAFGTEEDFRLLCDDARRLGIRIILDGVFNHTGADSKYFDQFGNYARAAEAAGTGGGSGEVGGARETCGEGSPGACAGPDSPYYSWYRFEEFPHKYDCWWGVGDLPNVEENEPSYREFIYGGDDSVIRKWLRAGASGWRLDVADELPDDFIAGIRKAVKETDPDGLLMGEVWEDASNKVSYDVQRRYFMGDELDSTMNYPVRDLMLGYILGKTDAETAVRKLNSLAENYPSENFYGALNLMGSHDRARTMTVLGDAPEDLSDIEKQYYRLPDDKIWLAKNRMKMLSLIQYALPGVPCLYYGDEAGLQGYEDPYNRGTYPWGREDEELVAHYRMLAQLRKQYPVLTDGEYEFSAQGEHVFVCERFYGDSRSANDYERSGDERRSCSATSVRSDDRIIVVANRHLFGPQTAEIKLPEGTEYVLELLGAEEIKTGKSATGSEQTAIDENCIAGAATSFDVELQPLETKLFYCSSKEPEKLEMERSAGVLCHVSSLPSGSLDGAEAFIDDLAAAGQKLWQILPLSPADDETDSPYSSHAVFAGNSKLTGVHSVTGVAGMTDQNNEPLDKEEYESFCKEEAYWLEDFALYTVIKRSHGGKPWQQWPEAERERKNLDKWKVDRKDELEVIKKTQFIFDRRWKAVKEYANDKGISVIGDIPIYAAEDSVDTWAHREVFLLGEDGYPLVGAGVPPDYFSEDGQHWGNPLYDWDALKNNDYDWWLKRVERAMSQYDYIRLDHFRSFSAFFAIPRGGKPRDGWWLPGAGKDFFEFLKSHLGHVPFLAEDLGTLDNQVYDLLKLTGCPGMLVYQFSADEIAAMDADKAATKILYSGTHDNQTLVGWLEDNGITETSDQVIEKLYSSKSPWVILPLQDILGLGDESRMNVPGLAEGNWTWRAPEGWMSSELCEKMKKLVEETGR